MAREDEYLEKERPKEGNPKGKQPGETESDRKYSEKH